MKQKIISLILCATFLSFLTINARNTYKGETISAETILEMSPEMPKNLKGNLDSWLDPDKNNEGYDLVTKLLERSLFSNRWERHKGNVTLMQKQGIKNMSRFNYVFELPTNKNYLVKIGGTANRAMSLIHQQAIINKNNAILTHIWNPVPHHDEVRKLDNAIRNNQTTPTFQHISRMAYWLLLQEFPSEYIKLTDEMYLYHVPGRPKQVSDDHYIIIEKKMPEAEILEKFVARDGFIGEKAFDALLETISHAGLWSLKGNIGAQEKEKKTTFSLYDLEQPNNTAPDHFFHKNEDRYKGNKKAGMQELREIMGKHKQQDEYYKIIDAFLMSLS